MTKKIFVEKSFDKLRLDLFLSLNFDEFTRSFIKKQIENENVLVNGKVEYRANYRVKEGDEVNLKYEKLPINKTVKSQNIKLNILHEDNDLVLVNKPAAMVVHPAEGHEKETLVNALLFKYESIKDVGQRIRAGLINRIDKDTSGIVLVGKNNRALWFYSRQFAQRQVLKEYLAIVKGDFSNVLKGRNELVVENYLGRNPVKRKKFTVVEPIKGKKAITKFQLIALSSDKQYSFVKVLPETGRTHQIRVHLSYLGYPIVGDEVYGGIPASRVMLHSYFIKIGLLNGDKLKVTAPLDKPFIKFLVSYFNQSDICPYIKPQKQNKKKKS